MIDELTCRVNEDTVTRSELDSLLLHQAQDTLDTRMGQIESQIGDLVGSVEDMFRELRNEEQARIHLEE